MKLKDPLTNEINYVKIHKTVRDSDMYVVDLEIDGEKSEYTASEVLMMGFEFVEVSREEMQDFNIWMDDTRFILGETSDYFQGKVDVWTQEYEDEEDQEDKNESN